MHRRWFKVYHQGQSLDQPVPVDDLPRRATIAGHVATYKGHGGVLIDVYVLAADAEQAELLFEEVRARLFAQ